MELKDKVYEQLVVQKLFGKNYMSAINKLSKFLKVSTNIVVDCLKQLKNENIITFKKKNIFNCKQPINGIYSSLSNHSGYVTIDNKNFAIKNCQDALDGDKISVYIINSENPNAVINRVIEKNKNNIVGRVILTLNGNFALIPDNTKKFGERIMLIPNELTKSSVGKKCSIEIISETNSSLQSKIEIGKINKVFGIAGDPIVENIAIACKYGFEKDFNNKVKNEVTQVPHTVSKNELIGRLDLRNLNFITIDPQTCKDMDDAVYVEKTYFGYKVITAIADVSHYVNRNSEIDKEAYKRGTSCYLGDGVYPMLPEELSNDMCSLNEKQDRLVMLTTINLDNDANILNYNVCEGVINSKHKLSYNIADKIHFRQDNKHIEYADVKNQIDTMFKLSDLLFEKRLNRGAIEMDNKEPDFVLDETKTKVIDVSDHTELKSTKIIESLMLLTNEVIGDYFTRNNLDTLFRVHMKPEEFKIKELNKILKEFNIDSVSANSKSYQKVLDQIKDSKNKDYLTLNILKSLQKAVYQPLNVGHFGLAAKNYIQFTSPIRRYPDLVAHRVLKSYLKDKSYCPSFDDLTIMGEHLSKKEHDAQRAERESNALLTVMWAENHKHEKLVGQIFEITGTEIKILSNMLIFTIPMHNLISNGYIVNAKKNMLYNKNTKTNLALADEIAFEITNTNRETKVIQAQLCAEKTKNTFITKDQDYSL